jgi:formyltetrahydrofolate deformylase
MQTFILLFQCRDQKGIVARISQFILEHGGNIITADQHSTDPEGGHFFMRVEFLADEKQHNKSYLNKDFAAIASRFDAAWNLYSKNDTLRMGILVSRADHCLIDLLYLWRSKELRVEMPFVASNYEGHRELVEQFKVPFYFIPANKLNRREDEFLALARDNSDFLVLARYMLVLSDKFLKQYGKDIINIHHGFLPSFKGADPYRQALEKGVKVIGATAHFVNEQLDEGPIISQQVERVSHRDDYESLVRKGKDLEKLALSDAIRSYLDYRIIRYRDTTIVF